MHRTTLLLSEDLRQRAKKLARRRRISLGELIRCELENALAQAAPDSRQDDPLFCVKGQVAAHLPADMSVSHDEYLYGE